ncbi:MAG: cation:proton antiporter [Candidatus Altiarchaeales archaeon]|nr:MAG: cation:proton antiporter [Candidatus Altiarchaeales archaeon]RLI94027.1 MAG: cation:proton antiporter [Candidatus Altiarchaeales archaeon]HDO81878.1 DUF4040 domain-containing protein [Candidatus Altiarchaeales archaeon]HEX54527.1 DUF4040 domain-containing protein [Candidatus Altiarchaeales archaeon]
MIHALDFMLLLLLVIIALIAISLKDILGAVIVLGAYSLIMALAWLEMNAPDVAFTEAAVGAGVTSFLFISALSKTKRWEK